MCGCESDASLPLGGYVAKRDSAGVSIVTVGEVAGGTQTWRVGTDSPFLAIGVDLQASAEHLFTRIGDAMRLSGGGVIVADGGENEVREYDANGNYVATWGREGGGPGEFRNIDALERWGIDSVAVWDMFGRSLTVFDMAGKLGRTSRVPTDSNLSLVGTIPDRRLVFGRVTTFRLDLGRGAGQFDEGYFRERQTVEIRDSAGDVTALLGPFPSGELYTVRTSESLSITSILYSRQTVAGKWGSLIVAGPNDTYELRAYAGDGSLRKIVGLDRPETVATDVHRTVVCDGERDSRPSKACDPDVPMASRLPMFDRVIGDRLGNLWVRDYDMPESDTTDWTVFDSAGNPIARTALPDNLNVREIGADYVVASQIDELGIHSLLVLPLHR